jgi:ubiquinone/menaquinone biosynthesis C-methylase UbiE
LDNPSPPKVTGATVRDDFNAISTVLHYTRAAHFIGLWKSELALIERYLPDKNARLLEAGCGAGRVAVGLWHQGYRNLTAFDFASELVDQAVNLAQEQGITGITFLQADATALVGALALKRPAWAVDPPPPGFGATGSNGPYPELSFDGALFMFNGLMQIPGRENRRTAMRELHRVCRPGAHFIFTTHDREDPADLKEWAKEAERWARGEQNPRLLEFGDRYFTDETGNTFMHLPDRKEVYEDMAATGWRHVHDRTRNELASETPKVRNFSDNCRFWVALKA